MPININLQYIYILYNVPILNIPLIKYFILRVQFFFHNFKKYIFTYSARVKTCDYLLRLLPIIIVIITIESFFNYMCLTDILHDHVCTTRCLHICNVQ